MTYIALLVGVGADRHPMDQTDAQLPRGVLELSQNPEAVCVTFAAGASVGAPPELEALFTCLMSEEGPLDGLTSGSHPIAVSLFEQARRHGQAVGEVRTLSEPDRPYRLHVFDLEPLLGCFAGIVTPIKDSQLHEAPPITPMLPPRHMVLHTNVTGVITDIDDATTLALGWLPDELVGRSALDFIDPEDHERSIAFWVEVLQEPRATRRVRQRWMRQSGSFVWMEATETNHLDDPELNCVVIELVDISDEMTAQTALREREELLARLTEALPIGVLQMDVLGTTVFSNPRWFEIAELHHGASFADFMALTNTSDRGAIHDAVRLTQISGLDQKIEIHLNTTAGSTRTCRLRLCALTQSADGHSVLASLEDITASHQLQRRLVKQAERDPLTDLLNRAAIMERLEDAIRTSRQAHSGLAVLFIDLDGFKSVNDRYGHAAGDDLLRNVAQTIRRYVRTNDLVGRLGGDEFVVITPELSSPATATELARRLDVEISSIFVAPGERLITGSIGVAVLDDTETSAAALLALADRRMYEAKRDRSELADN